jgi:hypothetical protein
MIMAAKRRNIFVGGSVLDNKYELQSLFGSKPKWVIWSDWELQDLLGSAPPQQAHLGTD